ncbi:tripartite tricarboxylate transporter substrate binding protein [Desulfitobacterium sp. AusDCA]|uniref:tripartite tricarboxylate transporter substrate binding protein n=1 Tax=Desulfitobacterium sp. AusDCA TaxID=3240383 RepID=UPI003DA6E543
MLKNKKFVSLMVITLSLMVLLSGCGQQATAGKNSDNAATKFPEKEITLICPWPAGGSSDLLTRAIAQAANKSLSKPIVIVNKDGANGMIATTELAKTKADGYTIAQGAAGLFLTQPFTQKSIGYKMDNFDFLIGLTMEPVVLSVNIDSPYKTYEDLIMAAKEKNLVIRYANSGMGGIPQLVPAYLFQLEGVKSQPVPFSGAAPALAAALGNHVDVVACHPGEAIPYIKAGKLRPLIISSSKRFEDLQDVPTIKEKGKNIDMGVYKFLFAPKGMPEDVKKVLVDAFAKAAKDPDFLKQMKDINLMVDVKTPEQTLQYFNEQTSIYKKLIEEMPKTN